MRTPPPKAGAQRGMITPYTRQGQEPRAANPDTLKTYGKLRGPDHNEVMSYAKIGAARAARMNAKIALPLGRRFDQALSGTGRFSTTSSTRPKSRLSSADI